MLKQVGFILGAFISPWKTAVKKGLKLHFFQELERATRCYVFVIAGIILADCLGVVGAAFPGDTLTG